MVLSSSLILSLRKLAARLRGHDLPNQIEWIIQASTPARTLGLYDGCTVKDDSHGHADHGELFSATFVSFVTKETQTVPIHIINFSWHILAKLCLVTFRVVSWLFVSFRDSRKAAKFQLLRHFCTNRLYVKFRPVSSYFVLVRKSRKDKKVSPKVFHRTVRHWLTQHLITLPGFLVIVYPSRCCCCCCCCCRCRCRCGSPGLRLSLLSFRLSFPPALLCPVFLPIRAYQLFA